MQNSKTSKYEKSSFNGTAGRTYGRTARLSETHTHVQTFTQCEFAVKCWILQEMYLKCTVKKICCSFVLCHARVLTISTNLCRKVYVYSWKRTSCPFHSEIINANLGRDDDDGTAMLVMTSQHFCFALQSSFETRAFNCRSLMTYHEKRCHFVITVHKVFNRQDRMS